MEKGKLLMNICILIVAPLERTIAMTAMAKLASTFLTVKKGPIMRKSVQVVQYKNNHVISVCDFDKLFWPELLRLLQKQNGAENVGQRKQGGLRINSKSWRVYTIAQKWLFRISMDRQYTGSIVPSTSYVCCAVDI